MRRGEGGARPNLCQLCTRLFFFAVCFPLQLSLLLLVLRVRQHELHRALLRQLESAALALMSSNRRRDRILAAVQFARARATMLLPAASGLAALRDRFNVLIRRMLAGLLLRSVVLLLLATLGCAFRFSGQISSSEGGGRSRVGEIDAG